MKRIETLFAATLVLLGAVHSLQTSPAADLVLFADSFADLKGHVISQTDGKIEVSGGAAMRRVLPFMGTSPLADRPLAIAAVEDPLTNGFDDKPGVLAISLTSVPTAA